MPELALLTGEALACLQALSGNFSKEAFHREQCVLASQTLQAASPGVPTDLTLFDCLHNAVLTDIKCGLLNVATLQEAREVARRVGKGGQGLVRTCDMTEVVAAVDGSHPSLTLDEASERATALTEEIEEGCGGEAALTASAYLVLGSALHRISKESNGAAVAAKAAWSKGVQAVGSPCIEAEALVKVGGLLYLSRLHLDHKEYAEADQAASDALAAAEQAQLPHAVSQAVCQLGVVRKRTGDFIVAEGLFRSCTNALIQARPGRCLTTWEMVVLGTATEEHCDLLSSMTFNSHSRQPEADLVREKFEQIARAFPVTANAALRLRQGGLQHWYHLSLCPPFCHLALSRVPLCMCCKDTNCKHTRYVRSFSPNLPTLLQQTD